MDQLSILYLANICLTAFLTGLSVFVLLVHYPAFAFVNPEQFSLFQNRHMKYTVAITMPAMVLEIGLAIFWLLRLDNHQNFFLHLLGFLPLVLVWWLTFAKAVGLHQQLLDKGFEENALKSLIKTHAIRTFFWAVRMVFLLGLAFS